VATASEVVCPPAPHLLREQHHNYPSGGKLTRQLRVLNDLPAAADVRVVWSVKVGKEKVAGDTLTVPVPGGGRKLLALEARLPEVKTPQAGVLEASTCAGGKWLAEQQEIEVFPPPPADVKAVVGVFGPGSFLAQVRAVAPAAQPIAALTPDALKGCSVLVVAPGTLGSDADAAPLEPFVRCGGRVVMLAGQSATWWAPVSLPLVRRAGTIAFARQPVHPVLKGLRDENLRDWLDDDLVFASAWAKPLHGNARAIIDAGEGTGLDLAPLVEARWGRGLVLFCQLAVAGKAAIEPAAALLLHNLLAYAATATVDQRPVALVASAHSPLRAFLRRVGAHVEDVDPATVHVSSRYRGAVVDGRERVKIPEALPLYIYGGGVVLIHCGTPEASETLPDMWRELATVRPASLARQQLEVHNRQRLSLAGWCDDDLSWPEASDLIMKYFVDVPQGGVGLVREPRRAGAANAEAGWALVEMAIGRGRAIFDQVEWDSASPGNTKALRLGTEMLDSVGVDMDPAPTGKAVALDLRPWCRLGLTALTGDRPAGARDQGDADLEALPVGEQRLGGVPFTILGGTATRGPAAVVLRGGGQPSLPSTADGLHVALRVQALYFLQACAGSLAPPGAIARYVARYADGRLEWVPVTYGANVADWRLGPQQLADAQIAWVGKKDATLYWMRWTNPHPEKEIASLDLVSQETGCVPALLAITAELAQ
jgi:hypothetical protein